MLLYFLFLVSIRSRPHPHTAALTYIFHFAKTPNEWPSHRQSLSNLTDILFLGDIKTI